MNVDNAKFLKKIQEQNDLAAAINYAEDSKYIKYLKLIIFFLLKIYLEFILVFILTF